MNNQRKSEIVEEELEENLISPRDELKDEIFDKLKLAFMEEKRLLGRFYEFSNEHGSFEYDEMGMNMEEGDEVLRKVDKIRDKILNTIQENLLYIFENIETNTLTNIITFDLDAKEFQYKVVLEVFSDSFTLEIR